MRYGITLMGNRIAPRCMYAETILMVLKRRNRVITEKYVSMPDHNLQGLCDLLMQNRVDTLICGGITHDNKNFLESCHLDIIDNVACSVDNIIAALKKGELHPGYGFRINEVDAGSGTAGVRHEAEGYEFSSAMPEDGSPEEASFDCLACLDRVCLKGMPCPATAGVVSSALMADSEMNAMLEAATDIACESERTLCRLSELIYFCLEMNYRRIGVAYCVDLTEPADILVRVLRRFFEVFPVCCKIGGQKQSYPVRAVRDVGSGMAKDDIACNPWGQARLLNHLRTDLNIMVGICMGADCVFMQGSQAPVTTLFVKDKSLANNPIGALYSDYYLTEAVQTRKAKIR